MIKKLCVDQSKVNGHNFIAFFSATLDYLAAEHIGDRFEIEDLRESLESDEPFFEKKGWFIRIIRKKDKFHRRFWNLK